MAPGAETSEVKTRISRAKKKNDRGLHIPPNRQNVTYGVKVVIGIVKTIWIYSVSSKVTACGFPLFPPRFLAGG